MSKKPKKVNTSIERLEELAFSYAAYGMETTLSTFGIVKETLQRRLREYRQVKGKEAYENILLAGKLRDKYTAEEIKRIINDNSTGLNEINVETVKISGENKIKFAVLSDLHLGSIFTSEDFVLKSIEELNSRDLDFVLLTGDVTEGMSKRDGHVYELSHIGYNNQKEYAIEILSKIKHKIYAISGNHDLWYYKANGALIVKDICENLPNAIYMGDDFATLKIPNGPDIGLWHGNDGAAYARSYRLQKIIESIDVETRPQIILTGHDHKYVSLFTGGVYGLGCGSMQSQSNFMKGKKLEANVGFILAEVDFTKKTILRFTHTFIRPQLL